MLSTMGNMSFVGLTTCKQVLVFLLADKHSSNSTVLLYLAIALFVMVEGGLRSSQG